METRDIFPGAVTPQDILLDEFGCYYLGDEVRIDDAFEKQIPELAAASAKRLRKKSESSCESLALLLAAMRNDRNHPIVQQIGEQSLMWWADDDKAWHLFQQLVGEIIDRLSASGCSQASATSKPEALDVRKVVYDYGEANVPGAYLGRLVLTFDRDTSTVDLVQEHGDMVRGWRATLPSETWSKLIETLHRYEFPRPPTDVEPPVPGSISKTISWERQGQIESLTISGRTSDYSDVNRIVWSVVAQMVPGLLRGQPQNWDFPVTTVGTSIELSGNVERPPRRR